MIKHQIQGVDLVPEDVGRRVIYVPIHAQGNVNHKDAEEGVIMHWNDAGVMVDYKKNKCRTNFSDLKWYQQTEASKTPMLDKALGNGDRDSKIIPGVSIPPLDPSMGGLPFGLRGVRMAPTEKPIHMKAELESNVPGVIASILSDLGKGKPYPFGTDNSIQNFEAQEMLATFKRHIAIAKNSGNKRYQFEFQGRIFEYIGPKSDTDQLTIEIEGYGTITASGEAPDITEVTAEELDQDFVPLEKYDQQRDILRFVIDALQRVELETRSFPMDAGKVSRIVKAALDYNTFNNDDPL